MMSRIRKSTRSTCTASDTVAELVVGTRRAVFWSVVEDYLCTGTEPLSAPLRVTIGHQAPIALGNKLEIITHLHPAGSTDEFGPGFVDRNITTLPCCVGDETKAVAAIVALQRSGRLTRPAAVPR
jgi:hypothetical protein